LDKVKRLTIIFTHQSAAFGAFICLFFFARRAPQKPGNISRLLLWRASAAIFLLHHHSGISYGMVVYWPSPAGAPASGN